jgi:hypothetical protein
MNLLARDCVHLYNGIAQTHQDQVAAGGAINADAVSLALESRNGIAERPPNRSRSRGRDRAFAAVSVASDV